MTKGWLRAVEPQFSPLGDCAVTITLGESIREDVHRRVRCLAEALNRDKFPGFVEAVAGFHTVTVFYEPLEVYRRESELGSMFPGLRDRSPESISDTVCYAIREIYSRLAEEQVASPRLVEIPVVYGGAWGPDLEEVAHVNGLTPDRAAALHYEADYQVYMVGFTPGFPYLAGLPEELATPRKPTPRLSVAAGSVGIAGGQTGIYPLSSPGGWQLIGRTPLSLFRPEAEEPSLLKVGDRVRFVPIAPEEFASWKGEPI